MTFPILGRTARSRTVIAMLALAGWIAIEHVTPGCGAATQTRLQDDDARERPQGRAARGSFDADRPHRAVVPRRFEEREEGPHGVRAPLRAHDVQGVQERRARGASVAHFERGRPEQRLDQRRLHRLLGNHAGAVPADGALARSRSHGHAADRREGVRDRARGRQGRAPHARREPALREAERDHLRPGVHHPSVQAPDDWQHGRPRSRVHRRRARLLQDLLRARERHARPRWRLRFERSDGSGQQVPGPDPEVGQAGTARHSGRTAAGQGAARDDRGERAAAGSRRGAPHHIRRASRFLSVARRLESAVRRAELADLSQAGVREAAGAGGVRAGESHRRSEPVLCRGDRAAWTEARGGDRRAHRRARPDEDRAHHRRGAATDQEPVRARLHPDPRVEQGQGGGPRARRGHSQRHHDGGRRVRHLP